MCKAQIANYVSNGGFEQCGNCSNPLALFKRPQGWNAIDSSNYFGNLFSRTLSTPSYSVPNNGFTYQWPRHGNSFFGNTIYCSTCSYNTRAYPRNTLKEKLETGKTYCFSMYVNLFNKASYALDAIGIYFADISTDTIKYCSSPITYLTPQIKNQANNFISDTLNWTLIRGLYTANGTEKYIIIGNFNNDFTTDTLLVNPTHLPQKFSSYSYDDVSCIDINLPAFAGNDNSIIPGDSIYLGRESDVGIDEDCFWYKLPMVITPTTPAIDTIAGFWIKPTTTETYVVKQDICGNVKWDTVVIYMNPLGLEKLKLLNEELKIYPVPANDFLELTFRRGSTQGISNPQLLKDFKKMSILNTLGQCIREEEFSFNEQGAKIKIDDLVPGSYLIQLKSVTNETVSKRFVVAR